MHEAGTRGKQGGRGGVGVISRGTCWPLRIINATAIPRLLLLLILSSLACFSGGAAATRSFLPRQATNATLPGTCVYVADALSATKGIIYAYDTSGAVVFSLNVSTTPSALAVDHTRQRLYAAIATNLLALDISHELESVQTACSCSTSYFTLTSTVTGVAVDETSGTVYFAYGSSLCYVDLQASYPTCTIYSTPFDSFGALTISQERRELYVLGSSWRRIYRFSLATGGFPTQLSTFQPPSGLQPLWGITMRQGNVLVGADPVDLSIAFPALLLLDPATGNNLATLSDLYLDEYSNLVNDNETGRVYHIIKIGTLFPNYTVRSFNLNQLGSVLTRADTTTFIPAGVLREPTALAIGRCPYIAPSPSPSVTPSASPSVIPLSDSATDLIPLTVVLPTVVGSVMACCACGVVVAAVLIVIVRRRRRWFENDADRAAGEGDVEMLAATKFTYREIDSRELKLGRLLGQGAFGKVYKGEYRGAVVAVKMFEGVRLEQADNRLLRELRSEAQMMEVLSNHPNIVKFVGAVTQAASLDDSFALVLEYCPRGSLYDLLVKKKKKLPLITLVRMARDAAFGILHLHKEKVIHRDIAARNMLVGQNYEVYVSDFGLARVKESEEEAGTTNQSFGPVGWMAPEALQSRQYSEGTDAFSFGVMLWEMMARRRPWAGVEVAQIVTAVVSNTRLKIPSDCDPVFRRLMKHCWRQNPAHRPSFDKIVITLSEYYHTLKKIQDVDTECPELSEESEEDATDEGRSDVSFASWEQKRMKDDIRSFLKQILLERGEEDFSHVERAYVAALQDLRRHYAPDTAGDTFPVIAAGNPVGQQSGWLESEPSNAYMSIISRKDPPALLKGGGGQPFVADDDGETTGAESAGGSSVVYHSRVAKQQPTAQGQPASAADAEAWLSPYAFPVLDGAGGVSRPAKAKGQHKWNTKGKKNVKWSDDDDDNDDDAGMKEEEEREEDDVGSNRNLKAMPMVAKSDKKNNTTSAKPPALPAFVSYASLLPPSSSSGGESAASIAPTSPASPHRQLPRTPPPKRPPRHTNDAADESGDGYASVELRAPAQRGRASGAGVTPAVAVPERSRAPPRPPRKPTTAQEAS